MTYPIVGISCPIPSVSIVSIVRYTITAELTNACYNENGKESLDNRNASVSTLRPLLIM